MAFRSIMVWWICRLCSIIRANRFTTGLGDEVIGFAFFFFCFHKCCLIVLYSDQVIRADYALIDNNGFLTNRFVSITDLLMLGKW